MNSGEQRRGPIRNGARTLAMVAGLSLVTTGCLDNPFSQDKAPTVKEIFKKANQKCANIAAKAVSESVTPEVVKAADSFAALTAAKNQEAADQTAACVTTETGIPAGTPGFEVHNPTIVITATAVAG